MTAVLIMRLRAASGQDVYVDIDVKVEIVGAGLICVLLVVDVLLFRFSVLLTVVLMMVFEVMLLLMVRTFRVVIIRA